MRHVSIDPVFFVNDIRSYSNWKLAFWRELFQNAVDQGAFNITITITKHDQDCVVEFWDDGPGMSQDVLQNVYFAVGASTKSGDSNSIGGMGRARILTCFAMRSYAIRSHNYRAWGVGGDWDIEDNLPHAEGCHITVHMRGCDATEAEQYLHAFLGRSRIPGSVTLNKRPLNINSGHLGKHVRDLTTKQGEVFGRVFVNKSLDSKRLLVRVRGVLMFSDVIDSPAQVVVELNAANSRNMLTSNRDSLREPYHSALWGFQQELASDTQSAVRDRKRRQTTVSRGGGLLNAVRRRQAPRKVREAREATQLVLQPQQTSEVYQAAARNTFVTPPEGVSTEYTSGLKGDVFAEWINATFGDIYIFDETDNNNMRKAITQYLPRNWILQEIGNRTVRKGGNIIRVLLAWKTACEYALDVYMDAFSVDSVNWGVGFAFADQIASCRRESGGYVFALRPVSESGKLDYRVTNRADLKRLMSSAKHEISHIAYSWHSESYSGVREKVDELFSEAECFRRIKNAIKSIPE